MQAIAESLDDHAKHQQGVFASRPAQPVKSGTYYYATDAGVLYLSDGANWFAVSLTDNAVTNARMADNAVNTAEVVNAAITNAKLANDAKRATYETALPGSPFDGQEIHFAANATNGVIWHLRYRSAASGSYKWEFVGGSPLHTERAIPGYWYPSAGGWVDDSTPAQIVLPAVAGDFMVTIQASMHHESGTPSGSIGLAINGAAPTFTAGHGVFGTAYQDQVPIVRSGLVSAIPASADLRLRASVTAANIAISYRALSVVPVRLG